jgi:hypothetical protein
MLSATFQPYETLKLRAQTERRARREAKATWETRYASGYANSRTANAVREGFLVGYVETALGGNGCPPPVPTRPVFSRYTFNHTYPPAVPWYEGYRLGHSIASARGLGRRGKAQIDPQLLIDPCHYNAHSQCRPGCGCASLDLPSAPTGESLAPVAVERVEGRVREEIPAPAPQPDA